MSSRAVGVARSRGSAEFSRQISPLPPVGRNDSKAASSGRNENQTVGRNDQKGMELTLFSVFPVRGGHESIPTSHTFAAFLYQVDILPDHQAQFSRFIVPGGHESIPAAHGGSMMAA